MLVIALAATDRNGSRIEGRDDFVWFVLRVKLSTRNVSGYFSSDMLYDTHFQNCVDVLFLVSIPGIILSVDLKCYFPISSDVSFNRLSSMKVPYAYLSFMCLVEWLAFNHFPTTIGCWPSRTSLSGR